MRSIVKYTIRQTVFINVVFIILTVSGVYSLFTTPVDNMPMVDIGEVFVSTVYFGASAEDVEKLITTEIEDALDGMENIEFVRSNSFRNYSSVHVKFIDDTDYRKLYDELRFRVLSIKDELPPVADEPRFQFIDTDIWKPVIMVGVSGDIPHNSLKQYAEDLKTLISSISNVRSVELEGEYEKEFHISLDPQKLRKLGITFYQVAQAVQAANTKIPTGRFKQEKSEFMLDAGLQLRTQKEALNVIVRRDGDNNFIRVKDLVTAARISYRDPNLIPSVNGNNTLRLRVTKEDGGNALTISEEVKQVARHFESVHEKDGIRIFFTNDSTIEINDSINTLGGNLLVGMTLVLIVLWATLGFRNSLITIVGIPFAFLCAIIIMKISGVSINTISLFSFVLVTGIMVDDAVIIMENIFRHLQMGKAPKDAVVDGTSEVMLPVISAAITTIFAFLPMLIMTGSTGEFFSYIPKTVTFALIASLLEALFILPIHILDWGPKKNSKKIVVDEEEDPFHHLRKGIFKHAWKFYQNIVTFLLNHKWFSFFSISGLFLSAMAILVLSIMGFAPLVKVKFFPGNYFRYHVTLTLPAGVAIETTDDVVRDVSRYIMSLGTQQAQSASGTAGYYEDQDYSRRSGHQYGEIIVTLPDDEKRDFPDNSSNDPMIHLEYMREKVQQYVETTYAGKDYKPKVKVFEESDGPPTGKPVSIRVSSTTREQALEAADDIKTFMKFEPALVDLRDLDDDRPKDQMAIKFITRQESSFEYGLLPGEVTALVAGALNGYYVGKFRAVDEEVDLKIRLARRDDPANMTSEGLADPLDILDIPMVEHSSSPIMLRDLVDAKYFKEPTVRARYKGKPTITISADIKPGSKISPARVQVLVNNYFKTIENRFPGVALIYAGEFESTSKSYSSLSFAFLIAMLAIYLVLASQFNNYIQPLIIISAVPFAIIGVVYGLFITRTTFTIGSFLAIVGLAGLAVNDSLLLIDFINVRLNKGRALRDAIIEACAARMRPVLITTVTTMLGLLPMAIGIPNRSISWAPMATAFVAGLSSATILALLMIPVEYEIFENIKSILKNRFYSNKQIEE
jgi:multidrug efflux pump subunit AcrB